MDQDLIAILRSNGFKPKEAEVYLALLELSRGTVKQIARATGLKRAIIYVVLEKLISEGYVTQLPSAAISQYQAIDPSMVLRERRMALKNFSEMLPLFQTLHNKGKERPRIQYLENKHAMFKIYEEMNFSKDAFFITSYSKIEKHFPGGVGEWIKNYRKHRYAVMGRHLLPDDPEELKWAEDFKKLGRKIKFLPSVKEFGMDFTLYDNKLAVSSLGKEPFMVLIESEELVKSMKPIFEIAWKSGKAV